MTSTRSSRWCAARPSPRPAPRPLGTTALPARRRRRSPGWRCREREPSRPGPQRPAPHRRGAASRRGWASGGHGRRRTRRGRSWRPRAAREAPARTTITSGASPITMKTTATTRFAPPPGSHEASRKSMPRPTNRIGHAQTTSGVPKPRANTSPIPTAISPAKMLSGANATTASGHSVSITYAPPDAQNPPRPMTTAPTWYSKREAQGEQQPRDRRTQHPRHRVVDHAHGLTVAARPGAAADRPATAR